MTARCVTAPWMALSASLVMADALAAQESTLTNRLGMEFVLIGPGEMIVGRFRPTCPTADTASSSTRGWTATDYVRCQEMVGRDAKPGFTVAMSRSYYLGRYEVTQAEWKRVMGANPSFFQGASVPASTDRYPVENVSWQDVQAFLARLNAMDTTAHYRLPTEFEWEFAARAGATAEPSWDDIRARAWQADVDLGTTHPVGTKPPNAWGLYDTLGNVWEWVADFYNDKFFADPVPPSSGTTHVLKGGSFTSDVKNTTWSTHAGGPGNGFDVGFRVLREIRASPPAREASR